MTSILFKPSVNSITTLEEEEVELVEKLNIVRELEACPTLMRHFGAQADDIAVALATSPWTGDAEKLKEWALRKQTEIGVYKHFYDLVQSKEAIIAKLQQVRTMIQQQSPNQE